MTEEPFADPSAVWVHGIIRLAIRKATAGPATEDRPGALISAKTIEFPVNVQEYSRGKRRYRIPRDTDPVYETLVEHVWHGEPTDEPVVEDWRVTFTLLPMPGGVLVSYERTEGIAITNVSGMLIVPELRHWLKLASQLSDSDAERVLEVYDKVTREGTDPVEALKAAISLALK